MWSIIDDKYFSNIFGMLPRKPCNSRKVVKARVKRKSKNKLIKLSRRKNRR